MNSEMILQTASAPVIVQPLLAMIPLLPLLGAATLGSLVLSGGPGCHKISGWLATLASTAAFVCTVMLFKLLNESEAGAIVFEFWRWIEVGNFSASFALRFDRLAAVMTLIVTGVGSLIHLYAIGYMSHDDSRPRFFCYLNLFLFAMLLLVLGDNLLLMFVGWEGVGLCSYLLIGFWYKDMANSIAGQKAFIVNRIGDAGFILGVFVLFYTTGTISFTGIEAAVPNIADPYIIEVAALLLFIGAVGKSAQIPLFVWLPDAMAGPTPVSALIHAATMVTAGIYMITRLSVLFVTAPLALTVISVVGALTAFVAATIAIAQTDIKKVLAYSTVSQLGYMFMALGAAAFSNGIYHVVTHAFFKACLFMGAGSVIVGCHHEQDMRKFGGLRKYMPWTCLTYVIATLAIAGIPPFSGFYSKDAILWTVFSAKSGPGEIFIGAVPLSLILWGVGLATAALTAFYMTRSVMLTFFGEYRGGEHKTAGADALHSTADGQDHPPHNSHDEHNHKIIGMTAMIQAPTAEEAKAHAESSHGHGGLPHESPWTMVLPLLVLMVLSAGFAFFFGESLIHYLAKWTRPDMLDHEKLELNHAYHTLENISKVVAGAGVLLAVVLYGGMPKAVAALARALPWLHKALLSKWWIDELYSFVIVRPLRAFSQVLFDVLDRGVIDAAVGGTGIFVLSNGEILRRMHTGKIATYAMVMLVGTLCVLTFWVLL